MGDYYAQPAVVTQDERTMATLAHALQIVGAFIAPLIIFFLKPESKFVRYHALQALLLQLAIMACWALGFALFFLLIFATAAQGGRGAEPPFVVFLFPLFGICGMLVWLVTLVLAIVHAVKAGQGQWSAYPVIGGIARRIIGV